MSDLLEDDEHEELATFDADLVILQRKSKVRFPVEMHISVFWTDACFESSLISHSQIQCLLNCIGTVILSSQVTHVCDTHGISRLKWYVDVQLYPNSFSNARYSNETSFVFVTAD
ncbi:hypothetical protein M758_UG113600 [Ceratodon purpureus]|nr:hypothetical protein M758_UG113600 [Ceratodon purpureus]